MANNGTFNNNTASVTRSIAINNPYASVIASFVNVIMSDLADNLRVMAKATTNGKVDINKSDTNLRVSPPLRIFSSLDLNISPVEAKANNGICKRAIASVIKPIPIAIPVAALTANLPCDFKSSTIPSLNPTSVVLPLGVLVLVLPLPFPFPFPLSLFLPLFLSFFLGFFFFFPLPLPLPVVTTVPSSESSSELSLFLPRRPILPNLSLSASRTPPFLAKSFNLLYADLAFSPIFFKASIVPLALPPIPASLAISNPKPPIKI